MDAAPAGPIINVRSFEVDDGLTCRYMTSVLRHPGGDRLEVAVRWSEMESVVKELRRLHPELPDTLVLPRYFFKTTESTKLEQRRQELNHFWTGLMEWLGHNEPASAQGLLDTPPLQRMLADATVGRAGAGYNQTRAANKLQGTAAHLAAAWQELASLQARVARMENTGTIDEQQLREVRAGCQALRAAAHSFDVRPCPVVRQRDGAESEQQWKPEELVVQQEMLTHLLLEGDHTAGSPAIKQKLKFVEQQLDRACQPQELFRNQ